MVVVLLFFFVPGRVCLVVLLCFVVVLLVFLSSLPVFFVVLLVPFAVSRPLTWLILGRSWAARKSTCGGSTASCPAESLRGGILFLFLLLRCFFPKVFVLLCFLSCLCLRCLRYFSKEGSLF